MAVYRRSSTAVALICDIPGRVGPQTPLLLDEAVSVNLVPVTCPTAELMVKVSVRLSRGRKMKKVVSGAPSLALPVAVHVPGYEPIVVTPEPAKLTVASLG